MSDTPTPTPTPLAPKRGALGNLFAGPNGDVSSKRVAALILIVSGITFGFVNPSQSVMAGVMIGAGTTLLGVQAITRT